MSLWTQHSDQHGAGLDPLLLRPNDAARMLGISPRTLWGLQDLPRVRIGRAVRYDVDDLRKWIESKKVLDSIPDA